MKTLMLSFGLFAIFACSNGHSHSNVPLSSDSPAIAETPDSSLADTITLAGQWYLVPVLPSDTVTGKLPHITFMPGQHRFAGSTGCNRMSGSFILAGHRLQFDKNIMTTKMACPGYNENSFLESLQHVNNFTFDNGDLILKNDEAELSRWSRHPVKLPKTREV